MAQSLLDRYKQLLQPVANSLSGAAGFIKKNPTAVGFANQQFQSKVAQPITQGIKSAGQAYANAIPSAVRLSPPAQLLSSYQNYRTQANPVTNAVNQISTAVKASPLAFGAAGGVNLAKQGAVGLVKNLAPNALLGGALSKITGGSFMQGVGSGIGAAPGIAGVTGVTNPLISSAVGKTLGNATNPYLKFLAPRVGTGLLNVPEGMVINSALGKPTYGLGDAAWDFGTGFVGGGKANAKGFDMGRTGRDKWTAPDVKELEAVSDFIRGNKKMTEEQLADADTVVTSLARGYLPTETIEKIASQYGKNSRGMLKAMTDELYKSFSRQGVGEGITMGIYGGKSATGFKNEGSFSSMADKKVRFEIDDSKAVLKNIKPDLDGYAEKATYLENILDHPTLFKDYPELKKMEVDLLVSPEIKTSTKGSFQPYENRSSQGLFDLQPMISIRAKNLKEAQSTLLHEIQHAIQEKEGFARGGSPSQMISKSPELTQIMTRQNDIADQMNNLRETFYSNESKMDNQTFNTTLRRLQGNMDALRSQEKLLREESAMNQYQRLSGEVEARDVQSRMNLTPEQRASTLPYQSQNIPVKDQIVRFEGGTQASGKNTVRVFHGGSGTKPLDTFDITGGIQKGKDYATTQQEGPGIYFTTDKDNAKAYGSNVAEADVDTSRFITDKTKISRSTIEKIVKQSPELELALSNYDENPRIALKNMVDGIIQYNERPKDIAQAIAIEAYRNSDKEFVDAMVKNGFDGLIVPREDGVTHFVLYNKDAVKTPNVMLSTSKPSTGGEIGGVTPVNTPKLKINEATKSQKTAFQGESGISIPPKIIGRSANVESALRESMSTATSPDDAINKLNQFVGEYAKNADKRQMADLRASLNKEITTLIGGSGDYKKDYAMRVALRNDTEMGGLIRQLESHIGSIDSGEKIKLVRPVKPPMSVFNAEPSSKTTEKLRQKAAVDEFNAWRDQYRATTMTPTQIKNAGVKGITESIKSNTTSPAAQNPETLNDISGWKAYMRDAYRNFKEVYGSRFEEVKRTVLDPFDRSKGDYVKMNESWASKLKTDIVDGLGIKKKSKESAAVQLYGEGQLSEDQLYAQFGPQKAEKIKKADAWFRKSYDELIDTINTTRKQLYPNSPEKWIAKRKDYYRHFREMQEGIGALFNIFDTPSNISSTLAGISEGTKPKAKFLSLQQQRKGPLTDIDAVGGFIDYIKQASYATHIDKHAERFRALSDELAQGTTESKNLNTFIEYLQDYANDLTGKTNPADRFIQKIIPGGRTTFRALNWINNRVKGNAVIGNVSSALSQIMNVPQGIASSGIGNFTKGIGRTLAGIFSNDPQINKSVFVKERYSDPFSQFDEGIIADTGKFAKWMTGALDNVGTRLIWNAQFEKAKSQGIQNAVKYADDVTRSLVAGRGIGEVPLMQKSRIMQLVAPFQLEVQNLWWVLKDMKDDKAAGKIITFFVANHLMNKGIEAIRGSDVTFDPIQSMIDGYNSFQEEDDKGKGALKFAGRQAGEVLGNVPFGQTVASLYPEYGATIGETKLPTRKDFFGKGNPVRQGSGLLAAEGLKDPLFKLIPPYGGAQIKKTIDGAKTLIQGYAGEKDKVQYPVKQNAENITKGLLFGKSGIPETRQYYDENRRPLSDKQSSVFLSSNDRTGVYNTFMDKRKSSAADDKAKEELKSSNQSILEKNNKIYILQDNGDVKTIDPTYKPTRPTLTGQAELDKKLMSKYNGEITKKANEIVELYNAGKMSESDAEKQLTELKNLKTSSRRPKKIAATKVKAIKIKKLKAFKPKKVKAMKIKKIKRLTIGRNVKLVKRLT